MVNVISKIVIHAPVDKVSSYAADPHRVPLWYVNIKSVEWKTPPPLAIGTQVIYNAQFLGRTLNYTYEVVEYVPGSKLVMQTSEGPFPMKTTYTWHAVNKECTQMILQNSGEPKGFSKLLAPFMSIAMKRATDKDLKRLKQILES